MISNETMMKLNAARCFAAAIVGLFCLIYMGSVSAQTRDVVDRVVAVVNEDIILLSELNEAMDPFLKKIYASDYPMEQKEQLAYKLREEVLEQIINEKLTDQQVAKAKIEVTEQEIDQAIERLKQNNRLTEERFKAALAEEGMTLEQYRERMREQILRSRLLNLEVKSKIVVTEDDIEACYIRENEKYCEKKLYHLRGILIKVTPGTEPEVQDEIRSQMQEIHKKLEDGADFAKMARMYSEPSIAEKDGYLGAFEPENIARDIWEKIEGLKQGDFTPVLKTDHGFQIIQVDRIELTPGKTLEEAHAEIEEKLYKEIVDKKFNEWLYELRKQSHIKINR